MTELLIIKEKESYFRFTDQGFTCCSLQKASVFPKESLREVRQRLEHLRDNGFPDAAIFTLTITETLFQD